MKLKPFKSGEKICFIGDSITAATTWISHIADCYHQNTNEQIEIYPCGISGGSCVSGKEYFDDQIAPWHPNTVVIKLGMNDVGGTFYGINGQGGDLERQKQVLDEYKSNLEKLLEKVKANNVNRIILMAPTPYDEFKECDAQNHIGWMNGLRNCAKIMADFARQYNCEFFDLGGQMLELLKDSYALGNQNELIKADRVHPTELGYAVMARLVLTAQGFEGYKITAQDIADGKAGLTLSDKAQTFHNVAWEIQKRWSTDWLVGHCTGHKPKEERYEFITKTYLASPEKFDNYEEHGPYFVSLAEDYEALVLAEEENMKKLSDAVKDLFRR